MGFVGSRGGRVEGEGFDDIGGFLFSRRLKEVNGLGGLDGYGE